MVRSALPIAAALLFAAGPAQAAVTYQFTGGYSFVGFTATFQLVVPTFITSNSINVPVTACSISSPPIDCKHISIYPRGEAPPITTNPEISFSDAAHGEIINFFLDPGALSIVGVHPNIGGTGQLVVSGTPDPVTVPTLSTVGLAVLLVLLAGLAMMQVRADGAADSQRR